MIGNYKLRERLGTGGMGEVWAAEQKQPLRRRVAIKLIKPGGRCDSVTLSRFELEVRATAKLTHWNTVEIYDYGFHAGREFIAMEYFPCGDLKTRLLQPITSHPEPT